MLSIGAWNVANPTDYCIWLVGCGVMLGIVAVVGGWLAQAILVVLVTCTIRLFRRSNRPIPQSTGIKLDESR
jgi:hypothetical protein